MSKKRGRTLTVSLDADVLKKLDAIQLYLKRIAAEHGVRTAGASGAVRLCIVTAWEKLGKRVEAE